MESSRNHEICGFQLLEYIGNLGYRLSDNAVTLRIRHARC